MWTHKGTFAIGGLENVGYASEQDLVIVLSSQGEGIFDCLKGERVARKHNDADWWKDFNQTSNSIKGFDCLENIEIQTSGLYGEDHLPKTTADGWCLLISERQPDDTPFEKYLIHRIYLISPDKREKVLVGKDGPCELRAYGFSETGASFIIALSCEVIIYSREM